MGTRRTTRSGVVLHFRQGAGAGPWPSKPSLNWTPRAHDADHVLDALLLDSELGPSREGFTRDLVNGVQANSKELDVQIQRFAPAWPVEQLSLVDRCLLRLAVFELTIGRDTSPKIVINEAVELAKLFGGESSPRFINGVLGSLHDSIQSELKG